ncbi:MAG: hypothetical protein HN396_10365 [Gemmatimonadales bacterium]|nr:hypothetical protein [Gemmatimonadales bacterium]MBT3497479.1 hypothetical protein [Gemmatimonadales bacterium]MBT3775121.1 hypothetical protein [Gemmatimonadales bacterium]MBT3958365.1 hypothetical protein [Gemmatimonadales bacterium]MBT4437591.1 hypothetical protein [Gemmatimonadales bacterium]
MRSAQELMGHTDIRTTMMYVQADVTPTTRK